MLSKFQGAIFDLDGTLIDSMGIWEAIDLEFLRKRGIPPDVEYTMALKNMNYTAAAEYTIRRFGLQETPEELMREWDEMAIWAYGHSISLKPGARGLLQELWKRHIPMALATASGPQLYEAVLKAHGIREYFQVITDVAHGVRGKDFPDIYLQAACKLRVPPESCMVFEDLLMGIRVAKQAGFQTCGVADFSSKTDWEIIRHTADDFVMDWQEAIELLQTKWDASQQ